MCAYVVFVLYLFYFMFIYVYIYIPMYIYREIERDIQFHTPMEVWFNA